MTHADLMAKHPYLALIAKADERLLLAYLLGKLDQMREDNKRDKEKLARMKEGG